MASTNQSPFYKRAEEEFLKAKTDEEKISCLEVMIREAPKHKSSEKMLKNLKIRLKKLKENVAKKKKTGKSNQQGIKKTEMQCVLVGFPNSGKSTIFNILTENHPEAKTSPHPFTTYKPLIGMIKYEDVKIQLIDDASIPNQDKSLVNSTDTLLVVVATINEIKEIEKYIWKSQAKKTYIFNKTDKLNEKELHKIRETLKSKFKELNVFYFNYKLPKIEVQNLKKEIFKTFPIIRVYTKEPGKEPSKEPMILKQNSTLRDAAEKILKGMSKNVKKARIWGPSSKFSGQSVGLEHKPKDRDIVEFKTK